MKHNAGVRFLLKLRFATFVSREFPYTMTYSSVIHCASFFFKYSVSSFLCFNWQKELLRLKLWYSGSIWNFLLYSRNFFCSVRSCIIFRDCGSYLSNTTRHSLQSSISLVNVSVKHLAKSSQLLIWLFAILILFTRAMPSIIITFLAFELNSSSLL